MPDTKISELPPATGLLDTDIAPVVQGTGASAETRRATFGQMRLAVHADRPLHVRDYGAVGNGTTDDTAAIQAALNAASAAGGGVVLLGPRRYLIDSAELVIPAGCMLKGQMDPGGFRVNNDFTALAYCLVLNPARTVRLRRNATVANLAIVRKGFAPPSSIRSALDAVSAFAGTAVSVGDGTTGSSATNAADATARDLLIIGFEWGIRSDGASRSRIFDILGDCTNGLYLGRTFDISQNERINWHPLATTARSYSTTIYTVTGAANNGSGLVRITLSAAHELQAGDVVIVRAVGGVAAANGRFTVAAAPTSTTLDLAGTAFAGTYSGGGTVDPGMNYRRGKGFHVFDADMPNFTNCFEFGHETGWHLDDGCHAACFVNCGVDGSGFDPFSYGVRITGTANRNKWYGGFWSNKGTALSVNVNVVDHNTIAGVMLPAGNGRSVEVLDGALILVGCDIYGGVYMADGADSLQIVGCDMKSANFSGQSAAALQKMIATGNRLPSGAGIARVTGGQSELAAFSSAGVIETRLSARSDGTVNVHRRSSTTGAQLRFNNASDVAAATFGVVGTDVVLETLVSGSLGERLRVAATGAVTLTGPLTLPADPAAAMQAATRNYVDNQFTDRRVPTLTTTTATALTQASHNARMVIANAGTTLSLDWNATGNGFSCMVVNRTGADLAVTLANFTAGIANADGYTRIKAGGIASLIAFTPDGGTTRICHLAGAGAP
ncbi:glycosyl hydrolase family 28-related protein [Muricoccus radiodurans]|uniref:glycosyl hydrolase family 28-related protein n=1 Tax=Muricoccus radiodurans TaxID=2231721 RepID=UPI003CFABD16